MRIPRSQPDSPIIRARMRSTILALLLCACRFDTGGVSDGGIPIPDVNVSDLIADSPAPDGGSCGPDAGVCCAAPNGRRVCEPATNSSAECIAGETMLDRECPPGSSCEGFVCALGTPCQGCDPGGCGVGEMCSVFVTVTPTEGTNLCCTPCFATPLGCGAPGTRCATNDQCASGICIVDDGGVGDGGPPDGGAGQCFYHCQVDPDCGDGGSCESRPVRVDGRGRDLDTCRRP